ncbi:MAG: DNA/RNA helicase domain-containing protein [Acidobacteriota bacterium]
MSAFYVEPLPQFVRANPDAIMGRLTKGLADAGLGNTKENVHSWVTEIAELQGALAGLFSSLPESSGWHVLLEYVIPVMRKRIDCVLLAGDLVYVIEYKGGQSASALAALRQAQEYALSLLDFHEESRGRTIVPIAIGSFKTKIGLKVHLLHEGAAMGPSFLANAILTVQRAAGNQSAKLNPETWNNSRYFPVPSIIEAASAIYHSHNVEDLSSFRAGKDDLDATESAIVRAVDDAIQRGAKKLLILTGVPGAGKTLAGLNAVHQIVRKLNLGLDQAAFLSGNGPLVKVLQEALKRSCGPHRRGAARAVGSRIGEVHRFIADSYRGSRPPANRLVVFDEAQRAWTAAKNDKKFNRNVSEPEMVLEVMGRHEGWAVVVALVGGGQEIHGGEAGLAAWGDAMQKHLDWELITSPEALVGGASVAGARLFRDGRLEGCKLKQEPRLHLRTSKRSYESKVTAAWVNAVLEGRKAEAASLANEGLPITITRELSAARTWLNTHVQSGRRAGLIASSGAARLRAEGVETPTFKFLGGIDYVKWFLEPLGDHRSSNQLEVALSEFEVQGLELDVCALLWGGDLVFPDGRIEARRLSGTKWRAVSGLGDPQLAADDSKTRILNKYRVLLTRFRKAMTIHVPKGSAEDETRRPCDFDAVYRYLTDCGVRPL